jgi:S-adenosylmethionine:tRNA ribosyltransferase-isomerase
MRISELDYVLPPDRIATAPAQPRDSSRLLVVQPAATSHHIFREIPQFLRSGDLLVVNNSRVLPAKLLFHRPTGGKVLGLFLRELSPPTGTWEVLLRTRGRGRTGQTLTAGTYTFLLEERLGEGLWRVRVTPDHPAATVLEAIGHVPLPPYISRQRKNTGLPEETPADRAWYQTVYAHALQNVGGGAGGGGGSVAAPTAGLHFTPELLASLAQNGVQLATVDLEVGLGTFLPIETETLEEHPMHTERYFIPAATVAALRAARRENRRIIAVGTTAVRTLESAATQILAPQDSAPITHHSSLPSDISGETSLLISPGFHFRLTDALLTNFHLPKSTLMALVAAFLEQLAPPPTPPTGIVRLQSLYQTAIDQNYRFYSYGDAMLILA